MYITSSRWTVVYSWVTRRGYMRDSLYKSLSGRHQPHRRECTVQGRVALSVLTLWSNSKPCLLQRILYRYWWRDPLGLSAAPQDGPGASRIWEVRLLHQPAQGRHPPLSGIELSVEIVSLSGLIPVMCGNVHQIVGRLATIFIARSDTVCFTFKRQEVCVYSILYINQPEF